MNLGRELVSLLRWVVRVLVTILVILIPLSVYGVEDFERVCNEEIAKEDINISLVQESCFKTAQMYERQGDIGDALWEYLLAKSNHIKIDFFLKNIKKDSTVLYVNLGHYYLLKSNYSKAKEYYRKFLYNYYRTDINIQTDFKVLTKLYPSKKDNILKGKEIWNRLYKPLKKITTYYQSIDNPLSKREQIVNSLKKIIKLKEKYLDKNLSISFDYSILAQLYYQNKEYHSATIYFNKELEIEKFNLGKNHPSLTTTYQNIIFSYEDDNNLTQAILMSKRLLELEEKIGSNYDRKTVINLYIGNLLKRLGKYKESEEFYNKALQILQIHRNRDDVDIASIYSNLANIYSFEAKYEKSLKYYKKALKIYKKTFGENSPKLATTYNNIGQVLDSLDYRNKALQKYQTALDILYKNHYNKNHKEFAMLYHNIATIYIKQGKYQESLSLLKKALAINIKNYSEYSIEVTSDYNNLAYLYSYIGQNDKALHIYNKLIEIYKILYPNHQHPNLAIIYNSMTTMLVNKASKLKEDGKIIASQKLYTKAIELSLKAIDINKHIYKTSFHPLIANSYSNIASILMLNKEYLQAEKLYIHALNIYALTLKKDNSKIIQIYNSLATLYIEMQKYDKALKLYTTVEQYYKDKNHNLVNLYHNLSALYFNQKKFKSAYQYVTQSFKLFIKYRNRYFNSLSMQEKSLYIQGNKHIVHFSFLLKTSIFYRLQLFKEKKFSQLNRVTFNTFNNWLNYKGTLFEYQNILSMIKNNPKTSKETKNLIEKLNYTNIRLSKAQNKEEIEALEEQVHTIEVNLSKQNESFKSMLQLNDINSSQIAKALKPHQLYIDFARGNDNYYLFTLDHQNLVTFQEIDANQTKLIDQYIKAYRENCSYMAKNLKTITANQEQQSINKAQRVLSKLYDVIVKEYLPTQLKGVRQLIISSDGLLNYFPFEALYHKGHYFVENYTINYISSGKEFIRQTKLYQKNPKKSMTIFANANFDAIVKAPMLFGNPHKEKIEKIFTNLGRSEIDIVKKYYPNATVFEESNATIANLVTAPSSKILHISTHGLLLKDKTIKNPMLKSVLVFAGANQNQKNATISALRLSALDLHNTELVVLSACQSGLGEIHQAEGVVGLPKALLQAGAKNVIMSLWTVSNVESAKLMDYFYGNISKGLSYSEALQQAKLSMITMHPYFWSAFVLSGL